MILVCAREKKKLIRSQTSPWSWFNSKDCFTSFLLKLKSLMLSPVMNNLHSLRQLLVCVCEVLLITPLSIIYCRNNIQYESVTVKSEEKKLYSFMVLNHSSGQQFFLPVYPIDLHLFRSLQEDEQRLENP